MRILISTLLSFLLLVNTYASYEAGLQAERLGDYDKAITEYLAAAKKDDVRAQTNLGYLYLSAKPNYKEAFSWSQKAYENGSSVAASNLGLLYAYGLGVERDYQKAFLYLRIAAEKNVASAQVNLGNLYYAGSGVNEDHQKAYAWYQKAYHNGDASAAYNIAELYSKGEVRNADMSAALPYYTEAANAGIPEAMLKLAKLYETGYQSSNRRKSIKKNLAEAFVWYHLAKGTGNEEAATRLSALEAQMTEAERNEGDRLLLQYTRPRSP